MVNFHASSMHINNKATKITILEGSSDNGVYSLSSYGPYAARLPFKCYVMFGTIG